MNFRSTSLLDCILHRRLALLFLLATQCAHAQPVSFGFKGGIPLTAAASVLYKRTGYRASQSDSSVTIIGQVRAHSWELPLLLKYYLPLKHVARPFITGGYVIRHLTGVKGSGRISGTTSGGTPIDATLSVPASLVLRKDPTQGIAGGFGVRLGVGRLHVAPEVRYTRWAGRPFDDQGPRGFSVQSLQNQAELLVGLSF